MTVSGNVMDTRSLDAYESLEKSMSNIRPYWLFINFAKIITSSVKAFLQQERSVVSYKETFLSEIDTWWLVALVTPKVPNSSNYSLDS